MTEFYRHRLQIAVFAISLAQVAVSVLMPGRPKSLASVFLPA